MQRLSVIEALILNYHNAPVLTSSHRDPLHFQSLVKIDHLFFGSSFPFRFMTIFYQFLKKIVTTFVNNGVHRINNFVMKPSKNQVSLTPSRTYGAVFNASCFFTASLISSFNLFNLCYTIIILKFKLLFYIKV